MFLQLDDLRKLYSAKDGLRHLSLSVDEGEFVTLLGPSGCGKTTTLNLIGGFLAADGGRILLEGADITRLPPEERPISTVFQSYALFPHLNVLENVAYGLRFQRGMAKRRALDAARAHLATVGLAGYEKARVGNLSGGQQQRVALARSMATKPKILLLDEPLSNLDTWLRAKMRAELKELQRELGITMLFVTHDQEEALCLSDRIVVMRQGEAVQVGTPQEIYFHPNDAYVAAFIGKSTTVKDGGHTFTVRPQDIHMQYAEGGAYRVTGVLFMGAYAEYTLANAENDAVQVIANSGEDSLFPVGTPVNIAVQNYIMRE